jgi:hypothetical protein
MRDGREEKHMCFLLLQFGYRDGGRGGWGGGGFGVCLESRK